MGRLIDADDVLKDIEELKKSPWYNAGKEIESAPFAHVGFLERQEAIQVVVDLFLKDPLTVDAEPVRHGRWIKMTGMLPPEYHGHYCCSECYWHMRGLRNSWTREEELLYCPNCGAKMDGDENAVD